MAGSKTETNTVETPTLGQVLQDAIENRLCDVHTAMPGTVVTYDPLTGTANIQPLLLRTFKQGELPFPLPPIPLPLLNKVPVLFPRTTLAFVAFPLVPGDVGLVIFSERSIDRYKTFGGPQDPQDVRKHDLSDGFFFPGGYPLTTPPIAVVPNALHMKYVASDIVMKATGEIEIKNPIGEFSMNAAGQSNIKGPTGEMWDLNSQHLDADATHTHGTAVGPTSVPVNSATYLALKVLNDGNKKV